MAKVRFDAVRKVYPNGYVGVAGATFEVADGELLVLVGPSGCGKSTLLRMVAGLEAISGGTLTIGERVVNDVAPKDRDIAMVFQSYALYPHMSVAENLAFGLKLRGQSKTDIATRVDEAAQMLELDKVLDRKPGQLSGGSASVSRWGARWSVSLRCSCSTSRCRTSTPSCAPACAWRSRGCIENSARR